MMMGLGFWLMLLVLSVPILLLIGLVLLVIRPILREAGPPAATGTAKRVRGSAPSTCAYCNAALQADWAHCPQCGGLVHG